jgi:hypothetical protein
VSFSDSGVLNRRLTTIFPGNGFCRVHGEADTGFAGAATSDMVSSVTAIREPRKSDVNEIVQRLTPGRPTKEKI